MSNPWQFFRRVPLTNAFQVIAPRAEANREFRAFEFVADPFGLELTVYGGTNSQLILYAPAGNAFEVEWAPGLNLPVDWETIEHVEMTNTFRIFAPEPLLPLQRYFRARPDP
ncbi:MAG TPA: hypothetical protein PLH97_15795 [Verrucomicrobiota bacterium]|nr:hypothetical protein [Verrucomicrobiota bacterium]